MTWRLPVVLGAVSCDQEGIPLGFHQLSLILQMLPGRRHILLLKGVCHRIVTALNVGQLATEFFHDELPSHDALSIECLVDQILVVNKDFDLLS